MFYKIFLSWVVGIKHHMLSLKCLFKLKYKVKNVSSGGGMRYHCSRLAEPNSHTWLGEGLVGFDRPLMKN